MRDAVSEQGRALSLAGRLGPGLGRGSNGLLEKAKEVWLGELGGVEGAVLQFSKSFLPPPASHPQTEMKPVESRRIHS